MKNHKGFTFVELLVVFVVLAILLLISVPVFVSSVNATRHSVVKNDLSKAYRVASLCFHDNITELNEWQPMVDHGMEPHLEVDIWLVDGHRTEKTLLIYAQHKRNPEIRYQVNHKGKVTRRTP